MEKYSLNKNEFHIDRKAHNLDILFEPLVLNAGFENKSLQLERFVSEPHKKDILVSYVGYLQILQHLLVFLSSHFHPDSQIHQQQTFYIWKYNLSNLS